MQIRKLTAEEITSTPVEPEEETPLLERTAQLLSAEPGISATVDEEWGGGEVLTVQFGAWTMLAGWQPDADPGTFGWNAWKAPHTPETDEPDESHTPRISGLENDAHGLTGVILFHTYRDLEGPDSI